MAARLSVIIPCKDEEANIGQCLQSVRQVADEVLVADSGSTDRTLEIARRSGPCRIIEREYVNSGDFKNWAIPQAQHDWVLIVDADERVPPALAAEIRQLLHQGPSCDGYWIYRANYFLGHRVRFSGWQSDRVLRLFRRDCGVYRGGTDHAEIEIASGRVGRLRRRLLHFSYWTYDEYFQRLQRYTSYQAQVWHAAGRRASAWKLATHLPLRFLQAYILRLGFLDGLVGLQISALTGYYSFLKQARLWQLQRGRTREQVDRLFAPVEEEPACGPSRRVA